MPDLDARKVRILRAIVNDYVSTSKPVGSERLIEMVQLNCKPATVRNEMADMAQQGYLSQPHISAGRIPTDRGYRYYVDRLMDAPAALAPAEARRARSGYHKNATEVEEILLQTCRILSNLTSYPSMATDPATDQTGIRKVYLTAASPRHTLLVALLTTGHVEHRLIETEQVDDRTLVRLAGFINSAVAGKGLEDLARVTLPPVPPQLAPYSGCLTAAFGALKSLSVGLAQRRVYLEGASQMLRQPEFQDAQRLEALFNVLEERSKLFQILSRTLLGDGVTIVIGEENVLAPMQDCSVITTSYRIGGKHAGYIGVVGPTRMNYDRAAAAVGLMASSLSQMLTSISIA